MRDDYDVSFENIHRNCKKSTPKQIALYQSSLKLHKTLNNNLDALTFEQVTVFDHLFVWLESECHLLKIDPMGRGGSGFGSNVKGSNILVPFFIIKCTLSQLLLVFSLIITIVMLKRPNKYMLTL